MIEKKELELKEININSKKEKNKWNKDKLLENYEFDKCIEQISKSYFYSDNI